MFTFKSACLLCRMPNKVYFSIFPSQSPQLPLLESDPAPSCSKNKIRKVTAIFCDLCDRLRYYLNAFENPVIMRLRDISM